MGLDEATIDVNTATTTRSSSESGVLKLIGVALLLVALSYSLDPGSEAIFGAVSTSRVSLLAEGLLAGVGSLLAGYALWRWRTLGVGRGLSRAFLFGTVASAFGLLRGVALSFDGILRATSVSHLFLTWSWRLVLAAFAAEACIFVMLCASGIAFATAQSRDSSDVNLGTAETGARPVALVATCFGLLGASLALLCGLGAAGVGDRTIADALQLAQVAAWIGISILLLRMKGVFRVNVVAASGALALSLTPVLRIGALGAGPGAYVWRSISLPAILGWLCLGISCLMLDRVRQSALVAASG